MANVTIPDLTDSGAIAATDLVELCKDPGGTPLSRKATVQRILDLVPASNSIGPGQCRLQVDSTTQISLQRYQGAAIPIKVSGTWEAVEIPSSGPVLANTGLTAATLYYIYAFDSGGTLTLEASATGHSADTDTGVRIKTGDATRTLVGMVYMDAGTPGTFVDSTAKRWCCNWFNRRSLSLLGTFSADRTTTSTSFTEINTEIRVQFLTWADEAVALGITGTAMQANSGQATSTAVGIDSTTVATQATAYTAPSGNSRGPMSLWLSVLLAEGFHYATLLGAVSGGTATWHTADTVSTGSAKTNLRGAIRG